jgi:hypothetical protein
LAQKSAIAGFCAKIYLFYLSLAHPPFWNVHSPFLLQGEQCNIVPDNVDDIVADLAPEEKDEGMLFSFVAGGNTN